MRNREPIRRIVLTCAITALLGAVGISPLPASGAPPGIDTEGWVMGAEEEALCRRALTECTPLIASIRDQQRESEQRRTRLRAKLRRHEQERGDEVARLELRIENLESQLEAIKGSRSWWITTPLRAAYALLFSE